MNPVEKVKTDGGILVTLAILATAATVIYLAGEVAEMAGRSHSGCDE